MRKLLFIAALAFTIFLSGCVGWIHWRDRDDRRHREDQRQEQDDQQRHEDDGRR
jgi:hypothetical protein